MATTLAAKLAVSAAMASTIMAGIEALRARQRAAALPPRPEEESPPTARPAPPMLVPQAPPVIEPQAPPARQRHDSLHLARIFGRASGRITGRLKLTIEDGTDSFEPRLDADGSFEMNLPPGSYTIYASTEAEAAVVEVEDLIEDEERDVTLVLAESTSIGGRIEGCGDSCQGVRIRAETTKRHAAGATGEVDSAGTFTIEGLVRGQTYELTVDGARIRRTIVPAVSAPRQGLVISVAKAAVLSGGFGVEPGKDCPMRNAVAFEASEPADHERPVMSDPSTAVFDRHCRFRIADLPDTDRVHVRATGAGWHFETDVAIPSHGDPPFLCFHPPCREPDPDLPASLHVTATGGAGELFVYARMRDDIEEASCASRSGTCTVEGLRAGSVFLSVRGEHCGRRAITRDLVAGANYLNVPCEAMRSVQGVLRVGAEAGSNYQVAIRCSSEQPPQSVSGRVFALRCPEMLTTIDYQLVAEGPWRSQPISVSGQQAFAEIVVE